MVTTCACWCETSSARTQLGAEFEYVKGSVTDSAAVERAVQVMDGVHVSLGVDDPSLLEAVEHEGTAAVAASAARHGVGRISYLTVSLVREEYGPKIAEHRTKLAALDDGRGVVPVAGLDLQAGGQVIVCGPFVYPRFASIDHFLMAVAVITCCAAAADEYGAAATLTFAPPVASRRCSR